MRLTSHEYRLILIGSGGLGRVRRDSSRVPSFFTIYEGLQEMARQAIDNGSWFDLDKATVFMEATRWNGNNRISVNTNSQWAHEALYRTAKGSFVLNSYSAYQGSQETWEVIDDQSAVDWLIRNERDVPKDLQHLEAVNEV